MVARQLLRRHQLTLPDGSSQGSTPAEEEEVVGRLSDQVRGRERGLMEPIQDQLTPIIPTCYCCEDFASQPAYRQHWMASGDGGLVAEHSGSTIGLGLSIALEHNPPRPDEIFFLQLHELSSRLEELEEDQKDSEGFRARLKKENGQLRAR